MIETSTRTYKKIREILGKKNIPEEIESYYDYIHMASKGIKAEIIKNFIKKFNLSRDTTADFLNISSPTIYRWIRANKNLERNYAIKLFELTELFIYGSEVFGNQENFIKWLKLPNTALGGMEPIELLEIPDGVSKVKDIIGRIEQGIYS